MKTQDRRITRTQSAIQEALFMLLEQRSIDKITIQDITILANINRSTFYLHYTDIYQLIEQVENNILSTFMEISKQTYFQLETHKDPTILSQGMTNVFTYIKNNARQFQLLLGGTGSPTFQEKITKHMKMNGQLLLNTLFSNQIEKEKMEYLLAFIASANLGIIKQWVVSGMHKSPSELADLISTLILGGVTKLTLSHQNQNRRAEITK